MSLVLLCDCGGQVLAGTLRALEPPHLYITVDQPLPVAARCRVMPLPTSPTAPLLELCGTVIDDSGGVLLDDYLEQDIEALRRALAAIESGSAGRARDQM